MTDKLSHIKELLENFNKQIQNRETIEKSIHVEQNPEYVDELDYWTREEAYIWINVETSYYIFGSRNDRTT